MNIKEYYNAEDYIQSLMCMNYITIGVRVCHVLESRDSFGLVGEFLFYCCGPSLAVGF